MPTTPLRSLPPMNVPLLRQPIDLGAILDLARRPGTHGYTIAALLDAWLGKTGTARDAIATAPPEALADLVRDCVDWCQQCHCVLPAWGEQVQSDVPLTYCGPCAEADQRANPADWVEYLADAAHDIFGGLE